MPKYTVPVDKIRASLGLDDDQPTGFEVLKTLLNNRPGKRSVMRHTDAEFTDDDGGTINILYYNSKIVSMNRNGNTTLFYVGFNSPSTNIRTNMFSPVRVYRKNRTAYAGHFRFKSGMTFNSSGELVVDGNVCSETD